MSINAEVTTGPSDRATPRSRPTPAPAPRQTLIHVRDMYHKRNRLQEITRYQLPFTRHSIQLLFTVVVFCARTAMTSIVSIKRMTSLRSRRRETSSALSEVLQKKRRLYTQYASSNSEGEPSWEQDEFREYVADGFPASRTARLGCSYPART